MLLMGVLSIGLALGLGIYLLAARVKPVALADGFEPSVPAPAPALADTEPDSLFRRMAGLATHLSPKDYTSRLQRRLDRAGNPARLAPERVLAFKGLGLVAGVTVGGIYGLGAGGLATIGFPVVLGTFGFFVPDILIRNLGEKRQALLQKALPDAMDMLTLCVEAGMGFDAALGRVARHLDGPVAQEFARVVQEMQFGLSRADALRSLSARAEVAELRGFVSAMIQSGELGMSIGGVLREQSRQMRLRRRQRAEEQAQKLQVKILAPLILCLLPVMFIVVLGPAIIGITQFFSKAG